MQKSSPSSLQPEDRLARIRRRNRLVLALLVVFVGLVFAYSFLHLQAETAPVTTEAPASV